jgi:predicted GIY-YIG superfamily endonuclease
MKAISKKFKGLSGVYCLININNGKRYIGSSKNIYQRLLKHRSLLRNGKHENIILNNAWKKHGENSFDWYILEICDKEELMIKEQFYIDTLLSEYNITKLVIRNVLSKESRIKQSETRKNRMKNGIILTNNTKSISMYSLEGLKLKTFNTIKQACNELNLSHSSICRFLNGTNKQAGGYLWSLNHENTLPAYLGNPNFAKRFNK